MAMAQKDLVHVNVHTTAADFLEDIKNRVFPTCNVIVWVDAATSKPAFIYQFLNLRDKFPASHSVFIPVGRRFQVRDGDEFGYRI